MTAVPLHIKRRFEQRWASRFTSPDTSESSQKTKSPPFGKKEHAIKKRPARKRGGTVHGVGG
jgi:hypothetical protein